MSLNKKLSVFAAIVLGFSCTFTVFAQANETISAVYKQIDEAVAAKNSEAISSILKQNRQSQYYPMIEAYTLKKTRLLIISDELEVARQTSLAVIDNNLENFDAVELYSYIDKAILNQQAANQALENRKRLEAERIAALNAKSKAKLESRGNYQIVNTASGQEVYVNEQQASFSSKIWTVKLGLADVVYQKVTDPDYSSLKYGLAFGATIFRPSERFVIGADIFADANIVTLMSEGGDEEAIAQKKKDNKDFDKPQEFFFSVRLVPELAFADISKNLFFRAGVAAHALASNDQQITNSTKTFISPVLGLALDNISLGESQFRLFADYDLGHLFKDDIKFAAEFGTSLLLPVAVNDKTKFGVEIGFQDLLLMKDEGMENRAKFTFAIGVGNVTK
ncbi:hypothetical protein [Treponema sp.]|uniref:hypothetical protein n=1 Tax=Treponema sp. TaxID=166 RepID=UPI00388E085C